MIFVARGLQKNNAGLVLDDITIISSRYDNADRSVENFSKFFFNILKYCTKDDAQNIIDLAQNILKIKRKGKTNRLSKEQRQFHIICTCMKPLPSTNDTNGETALFGGVQCNQGPEFKLSMVQCIIVKGVAKKNTM